MKRILISTAAAMSLVGFGIGAVAIADDHKGPHDMKAKHAEKHAEMLEKFDANGDGTIDEAEREAAMLAKFAEIDTDGSGALSQEEVTAHQYAKMVERSEEHFAKADANSDGVISVEEFETARHDRRGKFRKHRDGRRKAMLEKFDADGDGEPSESERAAAREAGYGRGHPPKFRGEPAD